jgi:hypothetical protein
MRGAPPRRTLLVNRRFAGCAPLRYNTLVGVVVAEFRAPWARAVRLLSVGSVALLLESVAGDPQALQGSHSQTCGETLRRAIRVQLQRVAAFPGGDP